MEGVIFISAERVRAHLKYDVLIPAIERALGDFSTGPEGGIDQPLRATANISNQNAFLSAMPSYVGSSKALACKLVSVYPQNAAKQLSTHQATILLFDEETGVLKSILDGEVITAMRTAAASVVATKHLALKTDTLAILGSGTQARSHIEALSQTFQFKKVKIWNHRLDGAEKLSEELKQEGIMTEVCGIVDDCVADADVIVTATFATCPILTGQKLQPWVHINAVGAPRPNWRELGSDIVLNSVVYADSYHSALNEAGDVLLAGASVYAEIGEVIVGKKEALREKPTIFKSLGLALEDAVSAKLVYDAVVRDSA